MTKPEEIALFNATVRIISDYDFSDYSEKSFARRLDKILADYNLDMNGLIAKIKKEKDFLEQIIKDITVNTTELFRDPKIWQAIKYRVLRKYKEKGKIRIWHAGCSSVQEVYSMLILLSELNLLDKAEIYASDINADVLDAAKKGEYVYRFNIEYLENFKQVIQVNPYNFEETFDIPYSKYFDIDKINDRMKVKNLIKDNVTYIKHDLVKGTGITQENFDIILCRNVLIYFNTRLQNKLFAMFADKLKRKGHLILGAHETIIGVESSKYIKHSNFFIKK